MAKNWYYRIVGEEFGPVDFDALFELARAGGLGPDDDVRPETADDWQPAATIVGLFPDEDDSSSGSELATSVSAAGSDDLASLLDSVTDDTGTTESSSADARHQWFVQVFNQELGPLEFEAVARMAQDGELAPSDPVRCGMHAEWIPAEQIVGLFQESDGEAESSSAGADDDPDRIWYYRIDDQEHGPFDFGQIMELAADGTIDPATHVRAGRVGEWMDAGSIVGLFPEPEDAEATSASTDEPQVAEPSPTSGSSPEPAPRKKVARKKKGRGRKRQPAAESDLEADVMDWLSDDIDQEIEEELEQRREPTAPSAPVAETTPPVPSGPVPPQTPPHVASPAAPTSSAASAALAAAVDAASSAKSSPPSFTPPPKAKRPRLRGPSFSFKVSMPDLGVDPKQIALLAVLGLVLLYIFFPFELNPAPEYYAETKAIVDRIEPLYASKAPPAEWSAVVTEVQPRVTELAEELDKLATARNPAMQQLLAIHRDYLPPVLDNKSDTPEMVFRRVTQTLELADRYIHRGPGAAGPPAQETASTNFDPAAAAASE